MTDALLTGIDTLIRRRLDWIRGRKVGLVAHPASVGADGTSSAELLVRENVQLTALFGPEHGFAGRGGAGEWIGNEIHPEFRIPIHSLYGETRKPTAEMLSAVDVLIFDLQDLGARPYTFVSTLRYVLEAAAELGKAVIVTDRPSPLAATVDGPMLDPAFESFVGCVRTPVVYGMTPGEAAQWLKNDLRLRLDLRTALMENYHREAQRPAGWPAWIPPSPAIRSWECGLCFPITVFFEALPAYDHGRGTATPFQLLGAPELDAGTLIDILAVADLPGIRFTPEPYVAGSGAHQGHALKGIRITVTDPSLFKPVRTGVALVAALQELDGPEKLWGFPGARPDFFDKLMGTDTVRKNLQAGRTVSDIVRTWQEPCCAFCQGRSACLLYS